MHVGFRVEYSSALLGWGAPKPLSLFLIYAHLDEVEPQGYEGGVLDLRVISLLRCVTGAHVYKSVSGISAKAQGVSEKVARTIDAGGGGASTPKGRNGVPVPPIRAPCSQKRPVSSFEVWRPPRVASDVSRRVARAESLSDNDFFRSRSHPRAATVYNCGYHSTGIEA